MTYSDTTHKKHFDSHVARHLRIFFLLHALRKCKSVLFAMQRAFFLKTPHPAVKKKSSKHATFVLVRAELFIRCHHINSFLLVENFRNTWHELLNSLYELRQDAATKLL